MTPPTAPFLLLAALSVPAVTFAEPVGQACDPVNEQAGLCFVSPGGFLVEAVTGPNGEFPVINDQGDSVFAYQISGPGALGGSCAQVFDISHASILVPASCALAPLSLVGAVPSVEYQTNGQGDPSCGFGSGDLENDVLKWDHGVDCDETRVYSIVLAGQVEAALTSFSLKFGPECSTATILGPGCPNLVDYCPGNTNSTGNAGEIVFDGVFSIAANDFSLLGTGLPPDNPGFFFFGTQAVEMPFGDGKRCVGGDVVRLQKIPVLVNGTVAAQFDFTKAPLDTVMPGIPYYFQLYYRDPESGGQGYNTTNALAILFTP